VIASENTEPDKVVDLEAQRDYMDMVCRSFASRLERRRNLVISSARFHRLVEQVHNLSFFITFIECGAIVNNVKCPR